MQAAWTWPDLRDGQAYEWRVEVSDGGRTETGPIWSFDVTFGPGDATGDGVVDAADILAVLAAWGTDDPNADVNDDGIVDFGDLLVLMAHWS